VSMCSDSVLEVIGVQSILRLLQVQPRRGCYRRGGSGKVHYWMTEAELLKLQKAVRFPTRTFPLLLSHLSPAHPSGAFPRPLPPFLFLRRKVDVLWKLGSCKLEEDVRKWASG
jgi:hypothetical protein